MIYLPEQLVGCRFIRVDMVDKSPDMGNDWNEKGIPGIDGTMRKNHCYGVLCGKTKHGTLIVVDFDDRDAQDTLVDLLPESFTVCTARRQLDHVYLYTDDAKKANLRDTRRLVPRTKEGKILLRRGTNEPIEDYMPIADIQGQGGMVIGPGTYYPEVNRYYEVVRDIPIAYIARADLDEIFTSHGFTYDTNPQRKKRVSSGTYNPKATSSPFLEDLKAALPISRLLSYHGVKLTSDRHTDCPMHDSKGHRCLHYDDNAGLYLCESCDSAGDIFSLQADIEGIDKKANFPTIVKILAGIAGMEVPHPIYGRRDPRRLLYQ